MTITFLIALALLATTHFALEQAPAPRVALSIGAVNTDRFHAGSSRIDNHYALAVMTGNPKKMVWH